MKVFLSVLCVFVISCLTTGCYYDNEEFLYGACDTSNVTFSKDIKPILDANCITCHSSSGAINLTTYEAVKAKVSDSTLYKSISYYYPANSSKNMPSSGKLDDCSINKVKAWIDEGAINN